MNTQLKASMKTIRSNIEGFSLSNLLTKSIGKKRCIREGDTLLVTLEGALNESDQHPRLSCPIAVTVTKSLPTGSFFISGKTWLTDTETTEYLCVLGIVNPADISPSNSISSRCLQDVKVLYIGDDLLSEQARNAWTYRYFSSHWSPL
ncbi:flagellar basal body L-ring protein FlgH [Shewanella sp.]|nr:flagellar basal body L-ring protein FlgH [Shewanella sp.]